MEPELLQCAGMCKLLSWLISPALILISVYGAFTWNALN